jgi:hypothetical protein
MPPRCAACLTKVHTDHALRLVQEIVAEDFFLRLFRQSRECSGKGDVAEQDGLAADDKGVFFVRLRLGKLDKLLICQIVKGNFPFPFLPQPYDFPDGGIPNNGFTKGVVLAPDILLIGFNLGHGNSPSLNNSTGRAALLAVHPLIACQQRRAGLSTAARMRRSS